MLSRNLEWLILFIKIERIRETRCYGHQDGNNSKQERIGNQYYR